MMNKKTLVFLASSLLVVSAILLISLNYLQIGSRKSSESIGSFEECVAAGNPIMESFPRQCKTKKGELFVKQTTPIPEQPETLTGYFQEQMWKEGVKNLGVMPIEGFTPDLYLGAFQNLKEEDFDNVRAINGIWEYKKGQLRFNMYSGGLITSADGTVSKEGMQDLLDNLEKRFGTGIKTEQDIDMLIQKIQGSL